MTKGRGLVRNQAGYRLSPINTQAVAQYPISAQYTPISSHPLSSNNFSHSPLQTAMSHQSYVQQPAYAQGGPVQAISQHQYAPMTSAPRPISARSSSGTWPPEADEMLMAARARDMNWGPIQQTYFPNKSANACRKRHERLMSKKSAATCTGRRMEKIAHSYMEMRKETWSPLAAQTGEKWTVVEQKVLAEGFKNVQLSARAYQRRLQAANGRDPHQAYDDSGVSGLEDLEAEFEDGSSNHSSASGMGVYGQFQDHQSSSGHLSAVVYGNSHGHSGHTRGGMGQNTHSHVRNGHHSSRLSSIDSIINGHDGRQ